MSGLNILYVAPYVPSPIRVRPYNILRQLSRMGHRISVVALEDGFASDDARCQLSEFCHSVQIVPHPKTPAALRCLVALPGATPLWVAHDHAPALEKAVRDAIARERFDVAHVENIRAAHIAPALGDLPRIIDAVDCITKLRQRIAGGASSLIERAFSHYEAKKLSWWEPDAYRPYQRIVVTTEAEAAALTELDPTPKLPLIEVIGNGVDTDYFRPDFDGANPSPEPNTIIFSGKMSYIANAEAVRYLLNEIFPLLRRNHRAARLIIAGAAPSAALYRLAAPTPLVMATQNEDAFYGSEAPPRPRIVLLPPSHRIEVTGYVEDMRFPLRRAVAAVCPILIGGGIQNKALEAMAMARPVVLSPLAARPLSAAVTARAAFVAADPNEYADLLAELLTDSALARRTGEKAREYVLANHRWQDAAALFAELYQSVIL